MATPIRSVVRQERRTAVAPLGPRTSDVGPDFSRRLAEILACAARVFCEKGYEGASIRDLSRESGVSLAGLYYYFKRKDELLYLIQKDAFETLIARANDGLAEAEATPVARLRALIHGHLSYFLEQPERSQVLSHEDNRLRGPLSTEIAALKRSYYRLAKGVVEEVQRESGRGGIDTRVAVLSLFGMMNWLYTWHNPKLDPGAASLAEQMTAIFLQGISTKSSRGAKWTSKSASKN